MTWDLIPTPKYIGNRKEIIKFLKEKGTKAAVEIGIDRGYVHVQKTDLIKQLSNSDEETLTDYDGNPVQGFIIDHGIFHLPSGCA